MGREEGRCISNDLGSRAAGMGRDDHPLHLKAPERFGEASEGLVREEAGGGQNKSRQRRRPLRLICNVPSADDGQVGDGWRKDSHVEVSEGVVIDRKGDLGFVEIGRRAGLNEVQ